MCIHVFLVFISAVVNIVCALCLKVNKFLYIYIYFAYKRHDYLRRIHAHSAFSSLNQIYFSFHFSLFFLIYVAFIAVAFSPNEKKQRQQYHRPPQTPSQLKQQIKPRPVFIRSVFLSFRFVENFILSDCFSFQYVVVGATCTSASSAI